MKARRVLIVSLFALALFSQPSYAVTDQSVEIQKCERILADLRGLIDAKDVTGNANVYAAVDGCFKKFSDKKLEIGIDPSIPGNMYGGMQFRCLTDMSAAPSIVISPAMIKAYKTRPSIVLSMLVHEMQHAKSYFDNTEYFLAMHNSDLEKYLYELDSYNIEANFIKHYLAGRNYSLTAFEKALVKSFDEDYLDSFSFGLLGYDMNFTFYLVGITKKQISYEEKIQLLDACFSDLLKKGFKNEGDKWNKYRQTVDMVTAVKFAPQVVRNVETMHGKVDAGSPYHMKNRNPRLFEILSDLSTMLLEASSHYIDFLEETQERFMEP